MKDLISERDKKEKMARSIVKWWNVHYTTPEELEQEDASALEEEAVAGRSSGEAEDLTDADALAAQEIIDRLNHEAQDDEAALQHEIEQARQEADANLNQATGAPSGTYGIQGSDEEHREQIDAILAEKDDALRNLIERTGEGDPADEAASEEAAEDGAPSEEAVEDGIAEENVAEDQAAEEEVAEDGAAADED